jgi:hypothetical protein
MCIILTVPGATLQVLDEQLFCKVPGTGRDIHHGHDCTLVQVSMMADLAQSATPTPKCVSHQIMRGGAHDRLEETHFNFFYLYFFIPMTGTNHVL